VGLFGEPAKQPAHGGEISTSLALRSCLKIIQKKA